LTGDHVATDAEAWVDLLGRWHQGEDVSACAFQRAAGWGKGRVLAFMPKVAIWAVDAGASVPKAWLDRVSDRPTDRKRTDIRTDADKDVPALSDSNGPETDRASDRKRTASCAGDPIKRSDKTEIRSEGEGAAPPPQTGVSDRKFGPSPEPVQPSPEVASSEMLPLLMAAGLNLGAASGVCRKLAEASVLVPRDADPLDEFDLGRIVGSDRKAATIKALRAGGWLPPKERAEVPDIPSVDQIRKMRIDSDERKRKAKEAKENGERNLYSQRSSQIAPSVAQNGQGVGSIGNSGMGGSSDDWIPL
jgi:hypothetical protein